MEKRGKQHDHEPIELFPRKSGKAAFLISTMPRTSKVLAIPLKEWITRITQKEIKGHVVFETAVQPVVVAFALTPKKRVIAVRQYRYGAEQYIVEVPGGMPDGDETPEETARRELEEETGFVTAGVERLTDQPIWFDPAAVRTPFWPCLAYDCQSVQRWQSHTDDHCEVLDFTLSEWIAAIHRGEIVDAKSIVATFLALPHLEGRRRAARHARMATRGKR